MYENAPGACVVAVEVGIASEEAAQAEAFVWMAIGFTSAALVAVVFVLTNPAAFPRKDATAALHRGFQISLYPGSGECLKCLVFQVLDGLGSATRADDILQSGGSEC